MKLTIQENHLQWTRITRMNLIITRWCSIITWHYMTLHDITSEHYMMSLYNIIQSLYMAFHNEYQYMTLHVTTYVHVYVITWCCIITWVTDTAPVHDITRRSIITWHYMSPLSTWCYITQHHNMTLHDAPWVHDIWLIISTWPNMTH